VSSAPWLSSSSGLRSGGRGPGVRPGRRPAPPPASGCDLPVHHTDAEREWAYDRTSRVGRLDKALDEAVARGWTVVDMKTDWRGVYPRDSSRRP
jgi:hypothetical protein